MGFSAGFFAVITANAERFVDDQNVRPVHYTGIFDKADDRIGGLFIAPLLLLQQHLAGLALSTVLDRGET